VILEIYLNIVINDFYHDVLQKLGNFDNINFYHTLFQSLIHRLMMNVVSSGVSRGFAAWGSRDLSMASFCLGFFDIYKRRSELPVVTPLVISDESQLMYERLGSEPKASKLVRNDLSYPGSDNLGPSFKGKDSNLD